MSYHYMSYHVILCHVMHTSSVSVLVCLYLSLYMYYVLVREYSFLSVFLCEHFCVGVYAYPIDVLGVCKCVFECVCANQ